MKTPQTKYIIETTDVTAHTRMLYSADLVTVLIDILDQLRKEWKYQEGERAAYAEELKTFIYNTLTTYGVPDVYTLSDP